MGPIGLISLGPNMSVVNSGLNSLELALRAREIAEGDEVILHSKT